MTPLSPRDEFRRDESLKIFSEWLRTCCQPLLITAPPYAGKTYFAKQIASERECVAAHFCRREVPESGEAASLTRSIATQLADRFPNLVLPQLHTLTLLAECEQALHHYLALPLASLPTPTRPHFLLIDNVQPHMYDLVLEMERCLPHWLNLVCLSRPVDKADEARFSRFHTVQLNECVDELYEFIRIRLPHCSTQHVVEVCEDSWFYVDALSRGREYGAFEDGEHLPAGTKELLDELCVVLPPRLPIYLLLVKAARSPPARKALLAAAQIMIHDSRANIERELDDLEVMFSCLDPLVLAGSWADLDGDMQQHHAAWAHLIKMRPGKTPQDVIEMAYHLAHSDVAARDSVQILSSVGASELQLACSVVDVPTSALLARAGARIGSGEKEDFVYMCSMGDVDAVDRMIDTTSERDACLGMLAAASRGRVEVCARLLSGRPTCARRCDGQWNALRAAACNDNLGVLEMLIQHGVSVDECGNGGRTALRAAAWSGHCAVVKKLLEAGADVERRDAEGRTALIAAAFMDHHQVVHMLLDHRANLMQRDSSGATALHLCLSNGAKGDAHKQTVEALINRGGDVNMCDAGGRACIHLAAYHGDDNMPLVIELTSNIDSQDQHGRTALMLSSGQGQLQAVQLLIEKGACLDSIDSEGRTALMLAAIAGHLPVVDLLLSLGADEAHKDNEGAVALHYAAARGCVQLVRALATESTLRASDARGCQPLIIACQQPQASLQVVEELLALGAPVSAASLEGVTALRAAALAGNADIVDALSSLVDDWEQADLDGTPLLHQLFIDGRLAMAGQLLALGAYTSTRDAHGRTAAHVVASLDDIEGARMLRGLVASFEGVDAGGRTPLMTAVWAGHARIAAYLLDNVGVDPNHVDQQGASALCVAAQLGNRELVALLLRFGADPGLRDRAGRSPIDVAVLQGHDHVLSLLKSATGSADSSGFGSMPASPVETKSLGRKLIHALPGKFGTASPRMLRRPI